MTHFALPSTHLSPPESPARALTATAGKARPRETHGKSSYPHGHGDVDSDSDADGTMLYRPRNTPTSSHFRAYVLYCDPRMEQRREPDKYTQDPLFRLATEEAVASCAIASFCKTQLEYPNITESSKEHLGNNQLESCEMATILEKQVRTSSNKKPSTKTEYSAGGVKVTVLKSTERAIYMKISYDGRVRNIKLRRSDPEGALRTRFGPKLASDMIRVIRGMPVHNRRAVNQKLVEAAELTTQSRSE